MHQAYTLTLHATPILKKLPNNCWTFGLFFFEGYPRYKIIFTSRWTLVYYKYFISNTLYRLLQNPEHS